VSWADKSRSNFDVRCCIMANRKMLHHNTRRVYINSDSTCSICCGFVKSCRFAIQLVVQQIHNKSNKWSLSYRPTCLQRSQTPTRGLSNRQKICHLNVLTVVGKSFHFDGRRCAYLRLSSLLFVFVNLIAYAWGD
jgi:hypothetical protein